MPLTSKHFIIPVNLCYVFRSYWPSSDIKYVVFETRTSPPLCEFETDLISLDTQNIQNKRPTKITEINDTQL